MAFSPNDWLGSSAPRAWTDPVCTEYAVEALTGNFEGGAGDGNTGS
ncbi:MAG: hypothetical protein H2053_16035 [Sphingomonas sp.]|nr:hypothetical protein [Sphingomonas sp.]